MTLVKFANGQKNHGVNPFFSDVFDSILNDSFLSDKLFDYAIEKRDVIFTPDHNPLVESINQDARNEYHLYHPTWREFVLFQ